MVPLGVVLSATVVGFLVLRAATAAPATYTDYDTNGAPFTVTLPQGNDSFADAFDSLDRNGDTQAGTTSGTLATGTPNEADPTGIPTQSVTLGDGGSVILRFTDNALTGSGNSNPDIYVFETGSNTELVDIYVAPGSPTAACPAAADPSYRYVGQTTKSYGGVDIDDDGLGLTARLFCARVVDVLNDLNNTSNGYNGAEIDAVGAIETVLLNNAPVNTVPGAQTTAENTNRVFNAANGNRIIVADIDADTGAVRVTLTATNGTLAPGGTTTGVTVADSGTSTLVLTGTVTNVNNALNGLTFRPNTNFAGTASLQVTTNDQGNTGEGGAKEDIDAVGITVTEGNDVPVITTSNGSVAYLPLDAAKIVDSAATVADPDSANFNGGSLTVDFSAGGTADDRLSFNTLGTITIDTTGTQRRVYYQGNRIGTYNNGGGTGTTPLVITFDSNAATVAAVQALVRNITYRNVNVNPSGTRTMRFVANDGDGGTSAPAYRQSNIGTIPPTISDVTDKTTNEDTATAAIPFTVGDSDDGVASLTMSGSSTNTALVPNGNIVFGGSGANRTVTITPAPDQTGTATITLTAADPDGATATDTFVLTVTPVNDPPVLSLPGDPVTYAENAAPAVIDGGATVIDIDSTDFDTGTLTADFSAGGTADDRLAISPGGNITVSDSAVSYNGTQIGTFAGGVGSTPLVVTFNANATQAAVQALAGRIAFSSDSEDPSTAARSVRFVLSDGDGGTSAAVAETVNVSAADDAPTISNIADRTIPEDTDTGDVSFTVNDPDSASLALSASSTDTTLVPNGNITFGGSGANRTVRVTPAANGFGGPVTVTVAVSDGGQSASDTFELDVTPVNDAPSFDLPANPDQTLDEDAGAQTVANFATNVSAGQFETQNVTFKVTNNTNPSLFSAGPAIAPNGNLTYTPTPNASGAATITMRARDDGGTAGGGVDESATRTFSMEVTAVNDRPTALEDGPYTTDEDTRLVVPAGEGVLAGDADVEGATLEAELVSGPARGNLTLDADGSFRYDPASNDSGDVTFTYRACEQGSDPTFCSEPVTVTINVAARNDTPVVDLDGDDPGVEQTAAVTFTEGAGPVLVDAAPALTVADVDDMDVESATVTVTNLQDGGAEVLSATGTANITVSYANGALTLTGSASKAEYEQVLRSVSYENTSQHPTAGDRTIRFRITDPSDEQSAIADATMKVVPVNDAPVVTFTDANGDPAGDTQTADEGQTRLFAYAVADADGGPNRTVTPDCGTGGTLAAGEPGDPVNSFRCRFPDGPATPNVTITVDDGSASDDTGSDEIATTIENVRPTVTLQGPGSVFESTTAQREYTFTVTDPGDDAFTVDTPAFPACGDDGVLVEDSLVAGASGGSFRCIFGDGGPGSNPTTNVAIRVKDSDGAADTDDQAVEVVTRVDNEAPSATFEAPDSMNKGQTMNLSLTNATDPAGNNDTLTYRFKCGAGWTSWSASSLHLCLTTEVGEMTVRGQVRDEDGGVSPEYSKTIQIIDVAPNVTAANDQSSDEGQDKSFELGTFTDPGTDGPWTVTADWGDGDTKTFTVDGQIPDKYHTYADDGNYAVTVTVAQAGTGETPSGSASFTADVANLAPTADDRSVSTPEETRKAIALTASDPGDDRLAYRVTSLPSDGKLLADGQEITAASEADPFVLNGSGVTYVPNDDYAGSDAFDFTACDDAEPEAACDPDGETVSIAVSPANDAPVVTVPAQIDVPEDAASPLTGISVSDPDAGNRAIRLALSVPAGRGKLSATNGAGVTVSGSGGRQLTLTGSQANINAYIANDRVRFTTAPNATAAVTLTVTANDRGNTGSGGAKTDTQTTTLNVSAVNDAPVARDDRGSTSEAAAVSNALISQYPSLTAGTPTRMYRFDTTQEPRTLTKVGNDIAGPMNAIGYRSTDRSIYGYRMTGTPGIMKVNPKTGAARYLGNPSGLPTSVAFNAGDVSPDGKTYYLANFGKDGKLWKVDLTTFRASSINLTSVLQVPDLAVNPIDGNLYGVALDGKLVRIDPQTGRVRAMSVAGLEPGAYGAAWFTAQGDLIAYENGTPETSGTLVWIARPATAAPSVVGTQEGPYARGNDGAAYVASPNQAGLSVVLDVLANDGDVDGELNRATLRVIQRPTKGTVRVNADKTLTYTSGSSYRGTDSFRYQVCDSGTPRLCDTATVNITSEPAGP